jgi:hypothetical protein
MPVFEVETWKVKPGKEHDHENALRAWMGWVKENKELFPEWKSLRYFVKYIAGEETDRHMMVWEYDSLSAFEAYKARKRGYEGPYKEYKKVDPYYMDLFDHLTMSVEVWKDQDRDLWIE